MHSNRSRKVGWAVDPRGLKCLRKSVARGRKPPNTQKDTPYVLSGGLDAAFVLFLELFIDERESEARAVARDGLTTAEQYFFGDWRTKIPTGNRFDMPPDPIYWHQTAQWSDAFVEALLMAACLDKWEFAQHFSTYPTDECDLDIEQTKEHRAWLLILAGVLREEPVERFAHHRAVICNSRRKRTKLLLSLLEGIVSPDEYDLQARVETYFNYFEKTERRKSIITSKLAIEGSFLVHYAKHLGRSLTVPESCEDYIVCL